MKVKKILTTIILGVILASPMVALATTPPFVATPQTTLNIGTINQLLAVLMVPVWTIFAFIVIVLFIYAGIMFITAAGNPDKVAAAKSAALYAVIGVVVGVLGYVIITVVQSTLTYTAAP